MSKWWILDGHDIKETDMMTVATWFETAERHVALDKLDGVRVSTVFLGIDHRYGPARDGEQPILFETMVFGGPLDQEQERYCTWDEAVAGHAAMLERVKAAPLTASEAYRPAADEEKP